MLRTLRGQLVAASVAVVSLVMVVLGGLLSAVLTWDARSDRDAELRREGELLAALVRRAGDGRLPGLAVFITRDGMPTTVRLLRGGRVVDEVSTAATRPPLPVTSGLETLHDGGGAWRSLSQATGPLQLQVLAPEGASPSPELSDTLLVAGLLTLGSASLLVWGLTGLALRPLRHLQRAATQVAGTRDLRTRIEHDQWVAEVGDVARSVNAMLARLEGSSAQVDQALDSSRRFAADAGHELRTPLTAARANLDALRRNPQLPPAERERMLADVAREQAQLLRVLDALQALAQGDAADALEREPVDLAELLDEAVDLTRRRHPGARIVVTAPDGAVRLHGWVEGLRLLLANLLRNAVQHGGGTVAVTLRAEAGHVVLDVDDDGPGVSRPDRERVFQRFARGERGRGRGEDRGQDRGLGLGLALVAQQVALHGGTVAIDTAPLGGARFTVTLPRP